MLTLKELQKLIGSDGCSFLFGYVNPEEDQRWLPKQICVYHDLLYVLGAHGYPGLSLKLIDKWMYVELLPQVPIRAEIARWLLEKFSKRRYKRAKQTELKPEMITAALELGLFEKVNALRET